MRRLETALPHGKGNLRRLKAVADAGRIALKCGDFNRPPKSRPHVDYTLQRVEAKLT